MRSNHFSFYLFLVLMLSACCRYTPTGWNYNEPDTRNGGFQKVPYYEQETAPDMVLVEGIITPFSKDNSRADTLNNFYISKYEETNGQYLAYVQYIKKYYSDATYRSVLPDTTVWLNENFEQEEKNYLVKNYFRDPVYKNFPVVGVSPSQIEMYAWWKTDRMNEFILVREGVLAYPDWVVDSSDVFTTLGYLQLGYYPNSKSVGLIDLNPDSGNRKNNYGERQIRMEDGILLPSYRLCTVEEWKHAAIAIGDENNTYLRTSKETSVKKYDKNGNYEFLKIEFEKKSKKNQEQNFSSSAQKMGNVFDHVPNNYLVYGLSDGVSEIVQKDSASFYVVGGSWKLEENYSAIYEPNSSWVDAYYFPLSFKLPSSIKPDSSGVVGFRLAMDRYGYPQGISMNHNVGAESRFYSKRRKGN